MFEIGILPTSLNVLTSLLLLLAFFDLMFKIRLFRKRSHLERGFFRYPDVRLPSLSLYNALPVTQYIPVILAEWMRMNTLHLGQYEYKIVCYYKTILEKDCIYEDF